MTVTSHRLRHLHRSHRLQRSHRAHVALQRRVGASAGLGAIALIALSACSPLPAGEVPIEASEPWVCPGVSRTSVDLMIGEGYTVLELGAWTDLEDDPFTCEVNGVHGNVIVDVTQQPRDEAQGAGAQQLADWRAAGAEQLDNPHGVPGAGYRSGTPGDVVTAGWVCGVRTAEVRVEWVWVDDTRDQLADAANLLQQVLPFVCANEVVPGVDYSPESGD